MSGNQIYARMPHGAVVTVLIPGDDWAKVNYNGYTGYAVSMGGAALLLCGR